MIRIRPWAGLLLVLGFLAAPAAAQNPVSIAQVGTTPVSTTVPVSGTITANQGGAPWSVSQSGNWLVQGLVAHDAPYGGNPLPTGCYASASAPAAVADGDMARMWCLTNGALSVNLTNASVAVTAASLPLPTGAATSALQTTGNTSLSSIDGKLPALVGGRVPVDGSGVTQPISGNVGQSGTWAVRTQDGSGNALTSATRGAQQALSVQIVDGSGNQITTFGSGADVGSTGAAVPASASYQGINVAGNLRGWTGFSLGTQFAGSVAIVDGSGNQITSFGGGTQYATGTASATPTGTVALGFDGANVRALSTTAGGVLKIDLSGTAANSTAVKVDGSAVTQPVSWTASTTLGGYVGRKPTYGGKTTITWTGTSLGNGSARESTAIDWTSARCADARIRVQTKGQASGTAYLDWYVYTALGDTTYTDLATGTDAAFTAGNRFNSRYLGSIRVNANTTAVVGEFQLSDIFGSMPDKWGLIGINNSGAALSATAGDHVLEYECVN